MSASSPDPKPQNDDQREALEAAERAASSQPGSYKEKATDDKIVGIPRVGPGETPIRGLDPE